MTIPELVSHYFVKIQAVMFIAGAFFCIRILTKGQKTTQFKVREADRTDLNRLREGPDLAAAKMIRRVPEAPPPKPLSLPGIRLSGEPYEILGVNEDAKEPEIMRAYKESIKRFHPDRIQGQAKEQIQFYEQASAKLNQAKDDMLKFVRAKKG